MDILISGASTGIGRACALALAKRGFTVWAGVRGDKVLAELTKLHVPGLNPLHLDVENSASIENTVKLIRKKSGTLFALVNNAGIAIGGPVEGVRPEEWRKQFAVNVFGAVELTQHCLPLLRESKGRVVNISSISGVVAAPFMGPYSASKFALEAFSDSLRREVQPLGVSVAVIEPGPIQTPIWKKSIHESEVRQGDLSHEIKAVYGAAMAKFLKRMEKSAAESAPVGLVVDAVTHAICARRPKIRYPVGRNIGLFSTLSRVLPDAMLDRALR